MYLIIKLKNEDNSMKSGLNISQSKSNDKLATANTVNEQHTFETMLPQDVHNYIFRRFLKRNDLSRIAPVSKWFYQKSRQFIEDDLTEIEKSGLVYYGICYLSNIEYIYIGDKTTNLIINLFGNGNNLSYRSEIPATEIYTIFNPDRDDKNIPRSAAIALFATENAALNYLKIDQQIQKEEDETHMIGRKNRDTKVYTRPIFKVVYTGDKDSLKSESLQFNEKLKNADAALAYLDRRLVIPLEGFVKFPLPKEGEYKTIGQVSFVKSSVEFKKTK
jgi:hypothetical protein